MTSKMQLDVRARVIYETDSESLELSVVLPYMYLPPVSSDSWQPRPSSVEPRRYSVISVSVVGVVWRRHVTRGSGSPVALHVSVTSSPSSTMTSSLDHASTICGATARTNNRRWQTLSPVCNLQRLLPVFVSEQNLVRFSAVMPVVLYRRFYSA